MQWMYKCCILNKLTANKTLQEHVDRAEKDLFNDRLTEIRLGVAMCSVTVLRYMTGAVSKLPISVVTRIGRHHDVISVLVPLIESPPWVRENGQQQERREGTQWIAIRPCDRFKLSNIDAQVCSTTISSTKQASCTNCAVFRA
jgi:hypothetical protein